MHGALASQIQVQIGLVMFNVVEIAIVHINNSSAPSFGREHEHADSALNIHCKLHNFDLSFLNLPCMHALMSLSPYYYITTLTWYIFFCLRQTTTMTRSSSSRQAATRPAHTSRRSAPGSSANIAGSWHLGSFHWLYSWKIESCGGKDILDASTSKQLTLQNFNTKKPRCFQCLKNVACCW